MWKMLFAVEPFMDTNQRQIALSVLESLRGDLVYAHLNNGSRVLDVADLRQYIYEQMNLIRTNALTSVRTVRLQQRPWARHQQRQRSQRESASIN